MHEIADLVPYEQNPVLRVRRGGETLRRRLEGAEARLDFAVLHELKASIFVDRARRGGDAARRRSAIRRWRRCVVVGRWAGGRSTTSRVTTVRPSTMTVRRLCVFSLMASLDHYSSTTTPPSLRRAVPIATPSQRPGRKMRRETESDVNEKVTNSKTRAARSRPPARSAVSSVRSA